MDEQYLSLMVDLHRRQDRQGPGGEAETARAVELAGLGSMSGLRIADIGCGTGASTLQLTASLDAYVTAVDFMPDFIEELEKQADSRGLSDRINTEIASMDALPFEEQSFDVIWSEGAIYNMGFEAGAKAWRDYLKPGGLLAVSEITWLTDERPSVLQAYWDAGYPEIGTASQKIAVLEKAGYSPVGYFVLPEHCWLDNYYAPLSKSYEGFLQRNEHNELANKIVEEDRKEVEYYERFRAFYSYGFYIARKV